MKFLGILAGAAASLVAANAQATSINFEDPPFPTYTGEPTDFSAAGAEQTYVVATGGGQMVTIAGGVILQDEFPETGYLGSVYATASTNAGVGASATLTNPLTFSFVQSVSDLQVSIVNAMTGNYELSDSAGHTIVNLTGISGTITLMNTGSMFDLTYLGSSMTTASSSWDYAIDGITFNPASTTVPEPATWTILMSGIALMGFAARRRYVGSSTRA